MSSGFAASTPGLDFYLCGGVRGPCLLLLKPSHGDHLHLYKALRAVGQARRLAVAEAAPDAPRNAFVPASVSQLRDNLVRHGLVLLLLQGEKNKLCGDYISFEGTITITVYLKEGIWGNTLMV